MQQLRRAQYPNTCFVRGAGEAVLQCRLPQLGFHATLNNNSSSVGASAVCDSPEAALRLHLIGSHTKQNRVQKED
jgi:hypothetical protein